MDENEGRVKRTFFSAQTRRLCQKAKAWKEISTKKEEISRLRSQLQLLEREMERLKKEAGSTAYDLWRGEVFCRDVLDTLFQQICDKGVEIRRFEEAIKELEQQVQPEKGKDAGEAEDSAEKPVFCPNCGAQYKKMVNFCRRCGARLREEEE